jgi:integrase
LAILRRYLEGSLERSGRSGEDLVFGSTTEEAFYASTIDHRAKRAWKQANARAVDAAEREGGEAELLRPITLHECRHTFASLMIAAGCNAKALSVVMGHSSIAITFDRYGKLMPGGEEEVGRLLGKYLDA